MWAFSVKVLQKMEFPWRTLTGYLGYPSMSYVLITRQFTKISFLFFPLQSSVRERSKNRRYIQVKLTQYSCNIMKNLIINIGLGKMHPINTSLVFFFKCVSITKKCEINLTNIWKEPWSSWHDCEICNGSIILVPVWRNVLKLTFIYTWHVT